MNKVMAVLAIVAIAGFALSKYGRELINPKDGEPDPPPVGPVDPPEGEGTAGGGTGVREPDPEPQPTKPDPQQLVDAFLRLPARDKTDKRLFEIVALDPGRELVTELSLTGAPLSDDGLKALASLPNLKSLKLTNARQYNPQRFAFLANLNALEVLDLEATNFDDSSMRFLSGLSHLRELTLSQTGVTDQGLPGLQNLGNLEVLRARKITTNGAGFKSVPGGSLRVLEVGRTLWGVHGWRFLKQMPNLEILRAGECGLGDDGMKALRGCSNLQELYIAKNGFTDKGLLSLKGLKNLKKLSLANNTISGVGLIVMKSLPQVIMLDINGTRCNDQAAKELVELLPEADIMYNGLTL